MPRVYFYSSLLRSRAEIFSEKFTNRAPHVERNNRYIAEQCSEKPMTASAWIENCSARRTQSTPLRATLASHCTWPQWRHKRVRRPWGRSSTRRSVPKPADGARGRSDGNHVSTLVSSPSWCVSSAAGSSDNHARVALFSLPLSLSLFFPPSLSLSLSLPLPLPPLSLSLSLSPPFLIPFPPVPPRSRIFFFSRARRRWWSRAGLADRPIASHAVCAFSLSRRERGVVEERQPRCASYATARLAPCPVRVLNFAEGWGRGERGWAGGVYSRVRKDRPTDRRDRYTTENGRKDGDATRRRDERAGCVLPSPRCEGTLNVRGFNERRCHAQLSPRCTLPLPPSLSLSLSLSFSLHVRAFCEKRRAVYEVPGNLRIVLSFSYSCAAVSSLVWLISCEHLCEQTFVCSFSVAP